MRKYFFMLCCAMVILFALQSMVFATDVDVLDVKTTFKIGGTDRTNAIIGQAAGLKIAHGVRSVTGSSTFSSGLGTVTAVIATPGVISDDVRYAMGTSSGANITLKVYGVGAGTATALSATPVAVNWQAIGTP